MLNEELRDQLQQKIDYLRRRRGAAALAGEDLAQITVQIAAAQAELDVKDEVQAEQLRREREAAEDAKRLARERLQARLAGCEAKRLEAVEKAGAAACQLALHLSEALEAAEEVQSVCAQLGEHPIALSGREFEMRLSGRLSVVLDAVKGRSSLQTFGRLELWLMAGANASDDWGGRERAELSTTISELTKGKQNV